MKILLKPPCAAFRALQRMVHYVNKKRLCVQPNYSWYQPDAYGPQGKNNQDPQPEIMRLNDHCMGHILNYLPLVDRIHFARICVRFRSVYEQVSPSLDKFIDFNQFESMTLWDVRDFFMLSGGFVKRFEGVIPTRHRQRVFDYLGAHCINLESLNIKATKITAQNMHKLLAKVHQLVDLQLDSCDLRNDALVPLKNLTKLKKLDLSNNANLSGNNMDINLPDSIETLILSGCVLIKAKNLAKLYQKLPFLKELNLKGISCIAPSLQEMPKERGLETVIISSGHGPFAGVDDVAKLPNMIKLIVHSPMDGRPIHQELLKALVEHKSNDLQHLEIRGRNCINQQMLGQIAKLEALRTLIISNCEKLNDADVEILCSLQNLEELRLKTNYTVSDNTLLRIIFACPKLHILHLYDCPYVTDKFIEDLVFKIRLQVRRQEAERQLPINLYAYHTGISKLMLDIPEVAAKDIIDLSLAEPSSLDMCYYNLHEMGNYDADPDSDDSMDAGCRQHLFDMGFYSDADFDDFDYEYDDYDDYEDDDDLDFDHDEDEDLDYDDDMLESWD